LIKIVPLIQTDKQTKQASNNTHTSVHTHPSSNNADGILRAVHNNNNNEEREREILTT